MGKISEEELYKIVKKQYEEDDAKFDIDKEKTILLVIDMQDEFVKPNWTPFWVPEATRQVSRIKKLINFCRRNRIPVIFTVYSKTHNYMDRPKPLKYMPSRNLNFDQSYLFIEGNVWHELKPTDEEIIIHKSSYGAFYNTSLETILKNLNKDTIIICGTLTNYCCSTTARQAFERGFKVVFGKDVTSAHFKVLHEAEIKVLRRGFAKILSLDEIMENIEK